MRELIVTEEESGQRLDKYLKRNLSYAPMSFFYKMLRKKNIVLNAKKADGSEKIKAGDRIRLFLSEETFRKFRYGDTSPAPGGVHPGRSVRETWQRPEDEINVFLDAYRRLSPRIRILYENDHIVVVDKPQGILSQKAESGDLSLNEWVAGYVIQEERNEHLPDEEILLKLRAFRPSVCHRLDRNTGGIVICAKTLAGSRVISELIRTRSVRKLYQLVAHGSVQSGGQITTLLSKDHKKNYVRVCPETDPPGPDSAKGILAKTVYHPLQTGNVVSLVEAELLTGRSHQLRVHFASIGHPIVGDPRYGNRQKDRLFRTEFGVKAQLLHCVRIEFREEVPAPLQDLSGRVISCDVPEVFQRIMALV